MLPARRARDYIPHGTTALLDAVGKAIHHIGNVHKYARKEDVPERTLFIITTDGLENASKHYSYDQIKQMIERQKEKYGWEVLFLGANIDAAAEADRMGIDSRWAAEYRHTPEGVDDCFLSIMNIFSDVRRNTEVDIDRHLRNIREKNTGR